MYSGPPTSPVDAGRFEPEDMALDRFCKRCAWSAGDGAACLPADGRPGGLLVVGDVPVKGAVRPFASKSGAYVRQLVAKSWSGPVVYDYAVKCPSKGGAKLRDAAKSIKACQPFLAEVVAQANPERVLAIGAWAVQSLLGRGLDLESSRRGYGWVRGDVPVFILAGQMAALENKFIRARYEQDFHWALTTPRPRPSHVGGIVHVVDDLDDALQAEETLRLHDELLFDVETAGVAHDVDFTVLCAGLAPVDDLEGDAWVWSAAALDDPDALAALQRLLATKQISGSNVKYDAMTAMLRLGISQFPRIEFDTQIVRKLLDPMAMGRLAYCVELVGMGGAKEEADTARKEAVAAIRRKRPRPGDPDREHWCAKAILSGADVGRYSFGLLPEELLLRYNGRDVMTSAAATLHLRERAIAEAPGELGIWESLSRPAIQSFERIERTGHAVDRQALESFASYLKVGIDELMQKFKAYGEDFNPGSPAQVAHILFDKLHLPKDPSKVSEKTGAPSTNKDALEHLRGRHPFVDDMLEFRRLEKMDNQYATGLIKHILSDGRIHTTFRIDGTETMRTSSENPNSQNLPRAETVEGKMCRDAFTASPGRILIELDQSQIELRVAAGMSGDPEMIKIFSSGLDFHMSTAKIISRIAWNIAEDLVTEWHRQYCKTINFGLLYGKTDAGLAEQLGCTIDEARKLRMAILGRFKKLAEMIKRLLYQVRSRGCVEIPWFNGAVHTRPLYEAGSHDKWKRSNAENASINSPIQGRAALYTVASIPLVHALIDRLKAECEIVNTVHDSIMLDCAPEWADRMISGTRDIMESFDCWGVPLRADVKAGDRWGSLRKIKRGELLKDAQVRWVAEALIASAT
jgi:DNA polymerase I-like protein with 3'-5' exonuclease and polymerase domains/uracil-DNA glycosylase